jgi:Tir chaperone family protein CesT
LAANDPLAQYLTQADRTPQPATGATGPSAQVEVLFNELGVPWQPDESEVWEWQINADVGEINSRIEPEDQMLLLFQGVGRVSGKPKAHADTMHLLMRLNAASTGACFAIEMQDDRDGYFVLVNRLPLALLGRETLSNALESFFRCSKLIDVLEG